MLVSATPTNLPFLFSYYLILVLSSPPYPLLHLSSYLKLCGRFGRNCLPSPTVLSGYNGSPDTRFSQATTRLISWLDGECYLRPLHSHCSLSPLISRIHSCLFTARRRTVSSKFFNTQVPSISTEELVLPRHTLVYAAMDTAFFLVHISLELAESRIFHAAPVDTRSRTLLILFCTVQLWTLCAAHSLATLCLSTTSGPDPGELPGLWGSMVFRHTPIPRKGSGNQQHQKH